MKGPLKPLTVVIVEDSPTVREFLVEALRSVGGFEVVETAADGETALEIVKRRRPDVVTMDVHLPGMDGFETTRKIMETSPTPIVIVSGSVDTREMAVGFRAIEAGALAILPRPQGLGSPSYLAEIQELASTLRTMSEVKLVKRWPQRRATLRAAAAVGIPSDGAARLVAIGASTGGPLALKTLLSGLSKDFPVPIAIVQHMSAGFGEGFVNWLSGATGFPLRVARDGDLLRPGQALVAPHGVHMTAESGLQVRFNNDPEENGMRPAVSQLFRSVARNFGSYAVGVQLTGMGKDGAWELKDMRDAGAETIAQDKETSVVHGMPGEAIRLGAAAHVLPIEAIAPALERLVKRK